MLTLTSHRRVEITDPVKANFQPQSWKGPHWTPCPTFPQVLKCIPLAHQGLILGGTYVYSFPKAAEITTNLLTSNNRSLFSPSPGGYKSEIKVFTGLCSPKSLEKDPFLPLPASGDSQRPMVFPGCRHNPPTSASLVTWHCLSASESVSKFLIRTPVTGLAPVIQCDIITTRLLQRPYFQRKSLSQVSAVRTWTYFFLEDAKTGERYLFMVMYSTVQQ